MKRASLGLLPRLCPPKPACIPPRGITWPREAPPGAKLPRLRRSRGLLGPEINVPHSTTVEQHCSCLTGSVALTLTCHHGSSCDRALSGQTCSSHHLQDETQVQVGSLAGMGSISPTGFNQLHLIITPILPQWGSPGSHWVLTLPSLVITLHHASISCALPRPVIFKSPAMLSPVTPAPWKEIPLTCAATGWPLQTVQLGELRFHQAG